MYSSITIYLDTEKKNRHVIRPSREFDGSARKLAESLYGDKFYKVDFIQ